MFVVCFCKLQDKDKEKQREMERIKRDDAIAIKLRLEKMYDEDSSVMGTQDDSQMTDISQETFPGMRRVCRCCRCCYRCSHYRCRRFCRNKCGD